MLSTALDAFETIDIEQEAGLVAEYPFDRAMRDQALIDNERLSRCDKDLISLYSGDRRQTTGPQSLGQPERQSPMTLLPPTLSTGAGSVSSIPGPNGGSSRAITHESETEARWSQAPDDYHFDFTD